MPTGVYVRKPSTCRKLSIAHQGKVMSDEARENMRVAHLGHIHSEETKLRIGTASLGRTFVKSEKEAARLQTLRLGIPHTDVTKRRMSQAARLAWQDSELRDRRVHAVLMGSHKRPSKPELIMMDIIQDFGLPFKYNGNYGKVVVGGLCPDFVSTNGVKMVILVDGEYYHSDPFRETRIDEIYKDQGYRVVHFTDKELYGMDNHHTAAMIMLELQSVEGEEYKVVEGSEIPEVEEISDKT